MTMVLPFTKVFEERFPLLHFSSRIFTVNNIGFRLCSVKYFCPEANCTAVMNAAENLTAE